MSGDEQNCASFRLQTVELATKTVAFKAPQFVVKNTFVDVEVDPDSWFVAGRKLKSAPAGPDYICDKSDGEDDEGFCIAAQSAEDENLKVGMGCTDTRVHDASNCHVLNVSKLETAHFPPFDALKFRVKNTFVDVEVDPDKWFVAGRKFKSMPSGPGVEHVCGDSDTDDDDSDHAPNHSANGDQEYSSPAFPAFSAEEEAWAVATNRADTTIEDMPYGSGPKVAKFDGTHSPAFAPPKFRVKNTFVDIEVDPDNWFVAGRKLRSAPAGPEIANSSDDTNTEDGERLDMLRVSPEVSPAPNHLRASAWKLSRCSSGSRVVQEAFQSAISVEERNALALQFKGHIWEAAHDLHANYVIQTMVMLLHPRSLEFVIAELACSQGSARLASQNKYACRVIQRLMEYCSHAQVERIAEDLLSDILECSRDKFSKYVMQSLLERGTVSQVQQIMDCLAQNAPELAVHKHGLCVIGKSLSTGPLGDQVRIAQAIHSVPGLYQSMSSPQGRFVMKEVKVVMNKVPSASAEPQKQDKRTCSVANKQDVEAGVDTCGMAAGQQQADARRRKKKRGRGGGEVAQKQARERDLVESLRSACVHRSPERLSIALDRVQIASNASWASPALSVEVLQIYEQARQILCQLTVET